MFDYLIVIPPLLQYLVVLHARCDCKGYWKTRASCAHILALAHWYGEEYALIDVLELDKVLPVNNKPGRKRRHTPGLMQQPHSPIKKTQPKPKVQTTPTGDFQKVHTRKRRR